MVGQTLGGYRVPEQVGPGSGGVVCQARDERLERNVALEVLLEDCLENLAARKLFRKEAQSLSKLDHPNIATIHDFDTEGCGHSDDGLGRRAEYWRRS